MSTTHRVQPPFRRRVVSGPSDDGV
jgi:hypothetical protein